MTRGAWQGLAAGLGLLILAAGLFAADVATLDVATTWMLGALLVVGWTTFCGPAQEVSLGHALFFGGGAYVAALLQQRAGVPPLAALVGGAIVAALFGGCLALLTARHRGLYFSMVTMAVQIALFRVLFLRSDLFGGEEGITGIRTAIAGGRELYLSSAALLLVSAVAATAFLRSRSGLLLGAIGQHETFARSLGVNLIRLRAAGLMIGAAVAGLGGAAWALTQGYVNPEMAGEELSARAALIGCLGGLWSVPAAAVASLGWEGLRFGLSRLTEFGGPISATLLLGLVGRPGRGTTVLRPHWDHLPLGNGGHTPARASSGEGGLSLSNVSVRFGGLQPLRSITLELPRGRAMGLIGPNGAGKTTLLNAIAGLVPAGGEMSWAGRSLTRLDTAARARRGVRKTFQHPARFADFSAWEHLQVALASSHVPALTGGAMTRLLAACEPVRGRTAADMDPGTLRLVEMVMALAAPPGILLLDEPYAGLSEAQAELVSLAIGELKAAGVTLLIVEHRLKDMLRTVDDLVVISEGVVLCSGPSDAVLADPRVGRSYLGT